MIYADMESSSSSQCFFCQIIIPALVRKSVGFFFSFPVCACNLVWILVLLHHVLNIMANHFFFLISNKAQKEVGSDLQFIKAADAVVAGRSKIRSFAKDKQHFMSISGKMLSFYFISSYATRVFCWGSFSFFSAGLTVARCVPDHQ